MSELSVPDNAIGRVGMLVVLQRINGMADGRLAIVRHPVGWVKEALHADAPTFAWQVFLTGDSVSIHGIPTQEVIVADKCLRPVSQLAQHDLTAMVEQHRQDVLEAAVAQVGSMVGPDAMGSPEFARAMHLAFSQAQLNFANEVVGVAQVLREVGFWKQNGEDGDALEWRSTLEGTEIHVTAGPGMFGDWQICAYAIKDRSCHNPETLALNDWPRGRVIQILLDLWESVFGSRRIPRPLELGWMYRQHMRDLKAIEPVLPHVVMDGDDFRRALRWLREAYRVDDSFMGPPTDVPVKFEIIDSMLRLRTDEHSIGVALQRGWVDAMQLSLRTLLSVASSALRGRLIRMDWSGAGALINGYLICQVPMPA